jgi:hypothetical protein
VIFAFLRALAGCTPGSVNNCFLFAIIGSRRVHLPVAIVSIGREGQQKRKSIMKKKAKKKKANGT